MHSDFHVEEIFSMEYRKGNVELINGILQLKLNVEMKVPSI